MWPDWFKWDEFSFILIDNFSHYLREQNSNDSDSYWETHIENDTSRVLYMW